MVFQIRRAYHCPLFFLVQRKGHNDKIYKNIGHTTVKLNLKMQEVSKQE